MTERIRVLFVDDEENILKAVRRVFPDDRYEILTAASGEQAIAVLEAGPPVQVVVSDYRMPGMGGVEFLRTVARRWPDAVRIALSGQADTSDLVSTINEGGVYKFIFKPWNEAELTVTIANAATLYFLERSVRDLMLEVKAKDEEIARLRQALGRALSPAALVSGEEE